jgi:hypothetical protein
VPQPILQDLGERSELHWVKNLIGQNIKVPIPDISALYSDTLVAGDSADTGVFCGNDGFCKVIVGGIGLVFGATCNLGNNLLDYILQSKSKDVGKSDNIDNAKPSAKDCNTAIKILTEYERLAEKYDIKLSKDRLKKLDEKRGNGTITIFDIPKGLRSKFPGRFVGKTLSEIIAECGR